MANVLVEESSLSSIANAIRGKNGTTDTYKPAEMATAIGAIETGGGDFPEEAFIVTGDCSYRFARNGFNWFVENYGDRVTTSITKCEYMFYYSNTLQSIPFDINMSTTSYHSMSSVFTECHKLKNAPYIKNAYPESLSSMFNQCRMLREIPEGYTDTWNWDRLHSYNYASINRCLSDCYSLRKIPTNFLNNLWSNYNSSSSQYNNMFESNFSLDEVKGLGVNTGNMTRNIFGDGMFLNCHRLKDFTFVTNEDGTPKIANWETQTIDLCGTTSTPKYVGYGYQISNITHNNSGITADKQVTDDATYQALKNDPDWFTLNVNYSRYNHDSAVNTINSLPDTSAYLAANGGTNTIKFRGAAGALTDGGAINTLTEEEIAVAAAKGWTVTFA